MSRLTRWCCLAALALAAPCFGQNCRQWQQAIPQQPGLFGGPVVYDPVHALHVMPGWAFDDIHDRYDPVMWEWDGRWWTPLRASSSRTTAKRRWMQVAAGMRYFWRMAKWLLDCITCGRAIH